MDLVCLDETKRHLRVDSTDHDSDILLKIGLASALVLDYLKVETPGETSPPAQAEDVYEDLAGRFSRPVSVVEGTIRAVTFATVARIFEGREACELTEAMRAALDRLRDPAMA